MDIEKKIDVLASWLTKVRVEIGMLMVMEGQDEGIFKSQNEGTLAQGAGARVLCVLSEQELANLHQDAMSGQKAQFISIVMACPGISSGDKDQYKSSAHN